LFFLLSEWNGFVDLSAELSDLEDIQTSGRRSLDTVNPRRRQRLNGESVAQLQQLEEQLLELEKEEEEHHMRRMQALNEMDQESENVFRHQEYIISTIEFLSKQCNLHQFSLPPWPGRPSMLSSHTATTGPGDTPVDPVDNADVHVDSQEDHATLDAADAHVGSPTKNVANGAPNGFADSPEGHI
jgi:TolA-binding protein